MKIKLIYNLKFPNIHLLIDILLFFFIIFLFVISIIIKKKKNYIFCIKKLCLTNIFIYF